VLTRALNVHEERVRALYQPLELVGLLSGGGRGVQEVNSERLHAVKSIVVSTACSDGRARRVS